MCYCVGGRGRGHLALFSLAPPHVSCAPPTTRKPHQRPCTRPTRAGVSDAKNGHSHPLLGCLLRGNDTGWWRMTQRTGDVTLSSGAMPPRLCGLASPSATPAADQPWRTHVHGPSVHDSPRRPPTPTSPSRYRNMASPVLLGLLVLVFGLNCGRTSIIIIIL